MNAHNGTSARVRGLLPHSLEEALPGVGVARRYERSSLRSDLVAGAIVAVVAVPSSLAMGELAGLPVVFGLYATFLPLVGYAIFGSSRHLVVGPDATMATLTAAIVAPMAIVDGTADPARYAALAAALALTMGLVLILAGTLRLGFVADFFGKPVLLGYISMRQRVLKLVDAADSVEWLVLNAEAWTYLDATAIDTLEQLHDELAERGVTVAVARLKGPEREIFQETRLTAKFGADQFFPTVRSAVDVFESRRRSSRSQP